MLAQPICTVYIVHSKFTFYWSHNKFSFYWSRDTQTTFGTCKLNKHSSQCAIFRGILCGVPACNPARIYFSHGNM